MVSTKTLLLKHDATVKDYVAFVTLCPPRGSENPRKFKLVKSRSRGVHESRLKVGQKYTNF